MTETNLLVAILAAIAIVGVIVVALVAMALSRLSALGRAREALDQRVEALGRDLAVVRAQESLTCVTR